MLHIYNQIFVTSSYILKSQKYVCAWVKFYMQAFSGLHGHLCLVIDGSYIAIAIIMSITIAISFS